MKHIDVSSMTMRTTIAPCEQFSYRHLHKKGCTLLPYMPPIPLRQSKLESIFECKYTHRLTVVMPRSRR